MIFVKRSEKPVILKKKAEAWTNAYLQALKAHETNPSADTKKKKSQAEDRYKHKEIRKSLKLMFGDECAKCAYCESHVSHIDHEHIEHFKPKSAFPELCFDWDNLLLGCSVCNGASYKADKFPSSSENGPLINPCKENPDDFFQFEFDPRTGTANVVPLNKRGLTTEQTLGLNRIDLVKHRSKVVKNMVFIALKAKEGDSEAFSILLRCTDKEDEYAAFARAIFKKIFPHSL